MPRPCTVREAPHCIAREAQAGVIRPRPLLALAGMLSVSFLGAFIFLHYAKPRAEGGEAAAGPHSALPPALPPTLPQEQREPCSLLTREDASRAAGFPIEKAVAIGNSCRYESRDPARWVLLNVLWTGGATSMKGARSALNSIANKQGSVPPSELIGDDTFIPEKSDVVMFVKGDVKVDVEAHGAAGNLDAAKAVARKIVEKL